MRFFQFALRLSGRKLFVHPKYTCHNFIGAICPRAICSNRCLVKERACVQEGTNEKKNEKVGPIKGNEICANNCLLAQIIQRTSFVCNLFKFFQKKTSKLKKKSWAIGRTSDCLLSFIKYPPR